jgi:hypothetical protein
MTHRPTLLNSCASAATAAEARYRIDGAPRIPRSTRVVALDARAGELVRRLATDRTWLGTRFFAYSPAGPNGEGLADVVLAGLDGDAARLSEELVDADFVMMVATADDGAAGASAIGSACTLRGITTAGLVVGDRAAVGAAVAALRPHARVLLVTEDQRDVDEILAVVGA